MERLDKFICSQTEYSRKEIKEIISCGKVLVNNIIVKNSNYKIDEKNDDIKINGESIVFKEFVYLLLNKPQGYISATEDKNQKTVLDLISKEYLHRELFPAGRLDKDTTGLMLITDDGKFAHDILAPNKHVKKTYIVTLDVPVTLEMKNGFENGVNLIDGECKKADLDIIDKFVARVVLTEGRYHQIKRMFGCFNAKVVKLHRIGMGNLILPEDLEEGKFREATKEELELISYREK